MQTLLAQRDDTHHTIYKVRRCFLWQQTYFQMDIYKVPCNNRCHGLVLLEAYTTLSGQQLQPKLPSFLTIEREVTDEPDYSMYNLSMKGERLRGSTFAPDRSAGKAGERSGRPRGEALANGAKGSAGGKANGHSGK